MDETLTTITRQSIDEGRGTLLRLGTREYYRYGDDHRWFVQPSGRPVEEELQGLLDELVDIAHELAPDELKPLDVDEVYVDLVTGLRDAEEAQSQELGRPSTPADRMQLDEHELAGALYGRYDAVAVDAIREALDRTYESGTLRSTFEGTQGWC